MAYGKKISLHMANQQKAERDDLKEEMRKNGEKAIKDFKNGTKTKGRSLFKNNKKISGFVFDKDLIQRFFDPPYNATQIAIIEASHLGTEVNFPAGSPTVAIVGLKPTGNPNQFIVARADTTKPIEPLSDEDAAEHPGTPLIIDIKPGIAGPDITVSIK